MQGTTRNANWREARAARLAAERQRLAAIKAEQDRKLTAEAHKLARLAYVQSAPERERELHERKQAIAALVPDKVPPTALAAALLAAVEQ